MKPASHIGGLDDASSSYVGTLRLALTAVVAPVRAATHFCDSFKSPTDPNWGNQDGAWIAKRKCFATQASTDSLTYTDLVSYQSLSDFTLKATVNDVYNGGIWLHGKWTGVVNGVLLVVGGAAGEFWKVLYCRKMRGPAGGRVRPARRKLPQDRNAGGKFGRGRMRVRPGRFGTDFPVVSA